MEPKYLKKKKSSGLKWVLIGAVLLVICLVIIMVIHMDRGIADENLGYDTQLNQASTQEPSGVAETTIPNETAVEESGKVEEITFKDGEIQTPYLTINYPECFEDLLLVINSCQDPYVLEFYAVLPERMEQRIFDVCLGAGSNGNLGVVTTDTGEILVSMTIYSFVPDNTWDKGEIDTVMAMQEAANELIRDLEISNEDEGGNSPDLKEPPAEATIVNFMQIETPYCMLQYPAIWADWIHTEQAEYEDVYRVEFYCSLEGHEPLLMFTVLFGGDEGEQLGVVTNTDGITVPVNILMNEPSEEGLQDEELNILYSMQEALNQLIQQLPLE